jgi:uncharacterized membrane protein
MEPYELLEIFMILAFGLSWPANVIRSYKSRTARGKSLTFLVLILFGYVCGITGKLMAPSFKWYVLFFYVLNFIMVGADLLLYFRNRRLDKQAEEARKTL